MTHFEGKLAIQQRVLTPYRSVFFDTLAQSCSGGLSVCAGLPLPEESLVVTDSLLVARYHPVHNLHLFRGPLLLCHQRGLQDWLAGWDPDVLIADANPRDISTPAAVRWMKNRGRPVLGWGLGAPAPSSLPPFLESSGGRMVKTILRSHLRGFDGLLTYSRRGAEEYAALGFPADRIFVAPNAATLRPSHPLPVRTDQFIERPNLLFVGRLQARKRIDALLQACATLPGHLQPRLVIIGDGPERAALESLAKKIYPLAEFTGTQHGAELESYFIAADLFVLPGTGGLAVQEAMSYGLPIIMGQGDGTNDDLVRPENGWQLSRPDLLAEVLGEALADVSRLRRMGAASYRIVSEEINLENMVAVFLQALNLIQNRRMPL
jgi:glycosyltransferase involved in cell wall biosynthesis